MRKQITVNMIGPFGPIEVKSAILTTEEADMKIQNLRMLMTKTSPFMILGWWIDYVNEDGSPFKLGKTHIGELAKAVI